MRDLYLNTDLIKIISLAIMLLIVFFIWYKTEGDLKRTIVYTLWTFAIFWINSPSFFVGTDGLKVKNTFVRIPFELDRLFDPWYIIVGNILLTIVGGKIGNSWEKIDCISEKAMKKSMMILPKTLMN